MLFDPNTHTAIETVLGRVPTEAEVQEFASNRGGRVEDQPVHNVAYVFIDGEEPALACLPLLQKYQVECRAIVMGQEKVLFRPNPNQVPADDWMTRVLPSLVPPTRPDLGQLLSFPIMENADRVGVPLPRVALGMDSPESWQGLPATDNNRSMQNELWQNAMRNLAAIQVSVEMRGGGAIAAASGNHYAAEKVFDAAFMGQLHHHFQTQLLAIGIPRKGLLIATGAEAPHQMGAFAQLVANMAQEAPLCSVPLLCSQGTLSGLIQAQA